MSFNYDTIGQTMGNRTSQLETELSDFSANMNPNDAGDMIKMQSMLQKWSIGVSLETTNIKVLGDALRGIIQKMG